MKRIDNLCLDKEIPTSSVGLSKASKHRNRLLIYYLIVKIGNIII